MAQTNTDRRDGTGNPFTGALNGQCTYWAQQRYHQLTGIWTPCTGNGYQWASQAGIAGWKVTSQPPNAPSIICLQPGVQGADRNFGHVGIVERINGDGSVYTSNYNVAPNHLNDNVVVYLTFHTGNGVNFIYAGDSIGSLSPMSKFAVATINYATGLGTVYTLSSNTNVADFLATMDAYLQLTNPFDIKDVKQDTVAGIGFSDPVDWLTKLAGNILGDLIAIILRLILLSLGVYILFKILSHFIDFSGATQAVSNAAMKVAPLLLA